MFTSWTAFLGKNTSLDTEGASGGYYQSDLQRSVEPRRTGNDEFSFFVIGWVTYEYPQSAEDVNPSFSKKLLENVSEHQLLMDEIAFLAGTIFEAGSDTVRQFPLSNTNGLSRNADC